jgi:hypothetical protein
MKSLPCSKLSDPLTCPAANTRRLRRSATHSPAAIRAASPAASARAGGDNRRAFGPAAFAGPSEYKSAV